VEEKKKSNTQMSRTTTPVNVINQKEHIQTRYNLILQSYLTTLESEWKDIIQRFPAEVQDEIRTKIQTLVTAFVSTEYYQLLKKSGYITPDLPCQEYNQDQVYKDTAAELIALLRKHS
jgi:hypothetical protein